MNKGNKKTRRVNGMRAEYDFSHGVRGKYASRYAQGTNLVPLAPDVVKDFPDAASVNKALRSYRRILRLVAE